MITVDGGTSSTHSCFFYSSIVTFSFINVLLTESIPKASELIEPLQRFIESSTLGEFSSRVQMLFSFYKEMCYKEDTISGSKGISCVVL